MKGGSDGQLIRLKTSIGMSAWCVYAFIGIGAIMAVLTLFWHCHGHYALGCDFFGLNEVLQIHKRRFFISAKLLFLRRDGKPSFVYLFCPKSDFFR